MNRPMSFITVDNVYGQLLTDTLISVHTNNTINYYNFDGSTQ